MSFAISYFMFCFTIVPYSYFMNGFLATKYKWSTLYTILVFALWTFVAITIFLNNILVRMILIITALYLCVFLFYKGKIIKKLITPIILIGISGFIEVPIDLFLFRFLNLEYNNVVSENAFFICQIVANLGMLVFSYVTLKVVKHGYVVLKKYPALLISSVISFFCIASCGLLQLLEISNTSINTRFTLACIMFVVFITTDLYFVIFFKRMYQNLKVTISMKKIEHEYLQVLNEYMDINDKMYRFIRHDITNQILQYSEMRSEENDSIKKN